MPVVPHLSRFSRLARLGLLCTLLAGASPLVSAQQALAVRLIYVGAPEAAGHRGASQGLAEANAQGEFLGQTYTLDTLDAEAATKPFTGAAPAALVAALPADALLALARAHADTPVLNVSLADDAVRAVCLPNLFHTLPTASMRSAAETQWRKANPEGPAATARAWHARFEKYAAAQLNKRYRDRFAQPMDDEAWAGWAAVKIVSDTVARTQSATPTALREALRGAIAFDGQKGVEMDFRADGQLRQPLLLVHEDAVVGEAPVRGVAEVEDLDSLGTATCTP